MLNKKWQECLRFLVRQKDKIGSDTYVRHMLFAVFFVLIGFFVSSFYTSTQFRVVYSLDQKANDKEIVKLIDNADKYVYFAIYYFTKNNIADALIRAKKRGLEVRGLTDRQASGESNKSTIEKLKSAGIDIKIRNNNEGIMHIKALVTDNAYASGSFNWTQSATISNDEIIEIGSNDSVRKKYLEILEKLLQKNDNIVYAEVRHMQSGKEYDFTEAKDHVGENAIVHGKVVKTYTAKSGVSFFDFCTSYKTCPFTAVIFASDRDKFGDLKQFEREVKISGLIKTYGGKAEIILKEREQVE